jgi:hypothetical protein
MVDTGDFSGIDVGDVGRGLSFAPGHAAASGNCMIESHLKHHLEPVAQRQRSLRLWIGVGICWLVVAIIAGVFLLLQRFAGWSAPSTFAALIAAALVLALVVRSRLGRWQPDFREVARKIEHEHPELHALLLTAVEQQPDPKSGQLNFLQERVIREALEECKKHEWIQTVSSRQLAWARAGHFTALLLLALMLFGLRTVPSLPDRPGSKSASRKVTVTPGDTKIERGSGLVVLARFTGPLPPEATLAIGSGTNILRRIPLAKTLNDPVFGGSIPEVNSNLVYRVEFGDEQTQEFKVTVFEHPRMERADAKIKFPEYSGLPDKKIEDTRRISAVEGSNLELDIKLNKPVTNAFLVAKDATRVPLKVDPAQPKALLEGLALENSKTYELQLVDSEGRTNKVPAQFVIEVLKNRGPELKVAAPRGDQRVTPLQEIGFQGEVWDDFGVKSYGIVYGIPGNEAKSIKLGESTSAGEKRNFTYVLPLEKESVTSDQLVSWYFWAEDVGPDGKTRRSATDMYFAEVRPFEEIFREGQAPSGGGAAGEKEQQQQSAKLAQSQKDIISATWKVLRLEAGTAAIDQPKAK